MDLSLKPPVSLTSYYGCGTLDSFCETGNYSLKMLIDLLGLKPSSSVLDVGCGVGRLAIPMVEYLTDGAYDGFDVTHQGLQWCKENISTRYPKFRFHHVDVQNGMYNPAGKIHPGQFRFPFDDGQFDIIHLGSVFTHMLPNDVKRYLSEISRTLKAGGRCLMTMFLLNAESLSAIAERKSPYRFIHDYPEYRASNPERHEDAVAYHERKVRQWLNEVSLMIVDPILYGSWCGRTGVSNSQDYVIAHKTAAR